MNYEGLSTGINNLWWRTSIAIADSIKTDDDIIDFD
jgi:hypothetical protein